MEEKEHHERDVEVNSEKASNDHRLKPTASNVDKLEVTKERPYREINFIGTYFAVCLGALACYGGFVMPATSLALIEEDIGILRQRALARTFTDRFQAVAYPLASGLYLHGLSVSRLAIPSSDAYRISSDDAGSSLAPRRWPQWAALSAQPQRTSTSSLPGALSLALPQQRSCHLTTSLPSWCR